MKGIVAAAAVAATLGHPAPVSAQEIGRFQIINSGPSVGFGTSGETTILLDTKTGQSWALGKDDQNRVSWNIIPFPVPQGAAFMPQGASVVPQGAATLPVPTNDPLRILPQKGCVPPPPSGYVIDDKSIVVCR